MDYDKFVELIFSIESISKKQAEKIMLFFLKMSSENFKIFLENLSLEKNKNQKCKICNFWNYNDICNFCLKRKKSKKILIVESSLDVKKFDNENIYNGKFFILEDLYDNKKMSRNLITNIDRLIEYSAEFNEIIFALNPSYEGEITTNYIVKKISSKIKISQIAFGIPVGSKINYIDPLTLSFALKNRKKIN